MACCTASISGITMLATKGIAVRSRIVASVCRSVSVSVQVMGRMPSPPACDTATARSGEEATGACRIGTAMPSVRQSGVVSFGILVSGVWWPVRCLVRRLGWQVPALLLTVPVSRTGGDSLR